MVFNRIFDKDQVYVHVTYGDIINNKDTGCRWDIRKEYGKDNDDVVFVIIIEMKKK